MAHFFVGGATRGALAYLSGARGNDAANAFLAGGTAAFASTMLGDTFESLAKGEGSTAESSKAGQRWLHQSLGRAIGAGFGREADGEAASLLEFDFNRTGQRSILKKSMLAYQRRIDTAAAQDKLPMLPWDSKAVEQAREDYRQAEKIFKTLPNEISPDTLSFMWDKYNQALKDDSVSGEHTYRLGKQAAFLQSIYAPDESYLTGGLSSKEKAYVADKAAEQQRFANTLGLALAGPVLGAPAAAGRYFGAPENVVSDLLQIGVELGTLGIGVKRGSIEPKGNKLVAGETQATSVGKDYHAMRAAERRATDEFDLVNQPLVDKNGQAILVNKRVDLNTGLPVLDSKMQASRPDAVNFDKGLILDDKPLGRPISKDQQEILRFIRAYEASQGTSPRTIAIERYNPTTGQPVVTELYKPSDFPLPRK